ncbi:MAG: LD-carboxypeptidase [Archangium sp.]|nr:LD-carboxypeptidase [Archangium sp.]
MFIVPPPLVPGARVAVVAPAGPFDRPSFERGLELLKGRYQPVFSEHLFDTHRYLAGTDAVRGAQLQHALDDQAIKAIFAARGGYGAMRLLPSLKLTEPKWLVGFSDITALHLAAQVKGWQSLHAPVLTQLGKQSPEVVTRFFDALEGKGVPKLSGTTTVVEGVAEGTLLGGNLSVLTRLIGTKWMPSLRGAVLLIEDVGERPYRLDRMWMHLKLSGSLEGVAGIAFGEFTGCDEKDAGYGSADVMHEFARELGVPCAAGFLIGHGDVNEPVILGARVRLNATARTVSAA